MYTIGTDFELFIRDSVTGKFLSSIPLIEWTKDRKLIMECGAGLHRDNVSLEVSSVPATSENNFVHHIGKILKEAVNYIPKTSELECLPSAEFGEEELDSPEALEIGCNPDYNAWSLTRNIPPSLESISFRSCGAHIHIGKISKINRFDFLLERDMKTRFIRLLDVIVGIPLIPIEFSAESLKRKTLYGNAGAYRPTPYGVEYRTLSNHWILHPNLVRLVYKLVFDALEVMESELDEDLIDEIDPEIILETINKMSIEDSLSILDNVLSPGYLSEDTLNAWKECLKVSGKTDLYENWNISRAGFSPSWASKRKDRKLSSVSERTTL